MLTPAVSTTIAHAEATGTRRGHDPRSPPTASTIPTRFGWRAVEDVLPREMTTVDTLKLEPAYVMLEIASEKEGYREVMRGLWG